MNGIEVTRHGDFQIATAPSASGSGFYAWGKMGVIRGSNPVDEPGEHVWFQLAETREAAKASLLAELGLGN